MISLQAIQEAQQRIAPYVMKTPVLEHPLLNERLGCRILVKAECLQTVGAFKCRGAHHFLMQLTPSQKQSGIVAFSSGNHAQAVAQAARVHTISATIVMPKDAPTLKIQRTREWGAQVVLYDRHTESREAIADRIAQAEGRTVVPPFNHPWIMAGQGTAGLEFIEELEHRQIALDSVWVPCSGGGLVSGISTVFQSLAPDTQVMAVEPYLYNDTQRSVEARKVVSIKQPAPTLCDSLALLQPGDQTLPIILERVSQVVTAQDESVETAMKLCADYFKLVVEPGGAIGLAAILERLAAVQGRTLGILLSGSNVDARVFAQALASEANPAFLSKA
jgi:threonine dehydratase